MTPSKTLSKESTVEGLLAAALADDRRHARLLNTFSLMEHIGSRKILLSQGEGSDENVLKHLSEETRHAHFFRRAAEKVAGRRLGYADADLAAGASARLYFGRLDAGISRETGAGALAYLYVTQAVEVRAAAVYALYERLLRAANHWLSLRSVIAEEDLHLAQMETELRARDPRHAVRAPRFAALEAELFASWLASTHRALIQG